MVSFNLQSLPTRIKTLRRLIEKADTNNDGVVTAQEMLAAGNKKAANVLRAAFKDAKANSLDGRVTPRNVSDALDVAVIRMGVLDLSGEGVLDGSELSQARRLPTAAALIDYVDSSARPQADALKAALKPHLRNFDLGMFGNGALHATVSAKNVNIPKLDRENALIAIGVKDPASAKVLHLSGNLKNDTAFWNEFVGYFQDDAGRATATHIRKLLTGPDVDAVASFRVDTAPRTPFSASIYLLARMQDGTVTCLKDSVDTL